MGNGQVHLVKDYLENLKDKCVLNGYIFKTQELHSHIDTFILLYISTKLISYPPFPPIYVGMP